MFAQFNPISAVTHPDPYPYYAKLVTERPLYFAAELGFWVASSAEVVTAVLQSPICRVRPTSEPVPVALLDSPAATIFRHLVRMNDGTAHCPLKHAVVATLQTLNPTAIRAASQQWATVLIDQYCTHKPAQIAQAAFDLSVYVVGSLLGLPAPHLPELAEGVADFVRCLTPTSTTPQIERGKQAAAHLYALFGSMLRESATPGLLPILANETKQRGCYTSDSVIANGIGLLSQAYEATAGLIGNTLRLLASRDDLRQLVHEQPDELALIVQEVLRYDPPIQNTRRFVAEAGVVAGQPMAAGDAILLVLAAANRDPQANPEPANFDHTRHRRQHFTFGLGVHACPGWQLAPLIAQAGVAQLLAHNIWQPLRLGVVYRPSPNARIALLKPLAHQYAEY
jgi:cytochrome P450